MHLLLLDIFTCEMFVSILLWVVCGHPWIYQRLLNVNWLHFLMTLSSGSFSVRMASWWPHSGWTIRCTAVILKIWNLSCVTLSLNSAFLCPFTVLVWVFPTSILIILVFAPLFLRDVTIGWRILILWVFFDWCPILILWNFLLLLMLVSDIDLLLFFSLFLLFL